MNGAPVGAVVRIYYDSPRRVAEGDVLVTRTGRTYLVASVRVQARGAHVGRQHLGCLVASRGPPESFRALGVEGQVHPLHWYPRGKRRNQL